MRPYRPLAETLPQRLIDHWRIDVALLDDRSRGLIVPDKTSDLALRADTDTNQVPEFAGHGEKGAIR